MSAALSEYITVQPQPDISFNNIDSVCAVSQITEKKSTFIGQVYHVESETQIQNILSSIKKTYPDARHHCYSYVLGKKRDSVRACDDGEPQGCAGRPILDVINAGNLSDTLIIVTRIFGGILLGTGGLTRAYSQAARDALNDASIVTLVPGKSYKIELSYTLSEKVHYYLEKENINISDTAYSQNVEYTVLVPLDTCTTVINTITDLTASAATITELGEAYIPVRK